jgi:predicted nucleic acid-binding protein
MDEGRPGWQRLALKALFDSSAILNLAGTRAASELLEGHTTGLSEFEIGNALWRQATRGGKFSVQEAAKAFDKIIGLLSLMSLVENPPPTQTLELAVSEGLTYYDASFLLAAIDSGLPLVTDDAALLKAASRHVTALATDSMLDGRRT